MPRKAVSSRAAQPKEISVAAYTHVGRKRTNNPPVGLVSTATDSVVGVKAYQHDPHIDPSLSWAGKAEGMKFEVPAVSLHVHERIDPRRIVKSFMREQKSMKQQSLFEYAENRLPLNKAIEFYSHDQDWSNRLIAGDSLLVMNSLIQKEGMAGKVQMIYIDPPYGIKYNSNFQPFVSKASVKEKDEDLPAEPETLKAFRDTWELEIHSYLTYLWDRLKLAQELLNETGSIFIQISDQNLHHVRELLDETFKPENFVSIIPFKKTTSSTTNLLSTVNDYIIWYAKDISKLKYRQLYFQKAVGGEGGKQFTKVELPDGTVVDRDEYEEKKLTDGKYFYVDNLQSASPGSKYWVEVEGKKFYPRNYWKTDEKGMQNLIKAGRIVISGNGIGYKRYFNDFPVFAINNFWDDTITSFQTRMYVVQTLPKVIERCMLMTTDPGDLILDPTCGSGTSAYVAEKWGRRWITCDTSRVAATLAKQRLMTSGFEYFKLAHPELGIEGGLDYKKVPHITLGDVANSNPVNEEVLYDQPKVEKDKIRVTGPFTVEAVPSLRTRPFGMADVSSTVGSAISRTGETANYSHWCDELKVTGIRATGGNIMQFSRIEPLTGTKWLHAEGEILDSVGQSQKAYISFGPDFGPLEQRQVEMAIQEAMAMDAKPNFVIFAAFHFDPEAAKDIDQIKFAAGSITVLKAQMSVDLLTEDLRKKRSSNQSFWLIGQPDIELVPDQNGMVKVKVNGFDYYNPVTAEIDSGGANKIAMWMLDTDYDEQSLLPEQVFFPMHDANRDWTKLTKSLNGSVDEKLIEAFTGIESLPFFPGQNRKIAVKIIDDRGIESFVVKSL